MRSLVAEQRVIFDVVEANTDLIIAQRMDIADARLLIAAPEMLEACRAAVPHHQGAHSEVGRKLRAAIAKAEGR